MFLKRTLKIILALIFVWGAFFHFVDVYHIYIAEQVEEDQFELSAVYTWVNGSDPAYLEQKRQFPPPGKKMDSSSDSGTLVDTGNNRWRDNGELKFSLRSLHQNAKWLKKIYIVINDGTNPPSWLNTKHKKIKIVYTSEIFPGEDPNNSTQIPTFNSNTLEAHLHNIKGVTSRFLYLNDDFYMLNEVKPHHFLTPRGGPKFFWSSQTVPDYSWYYNLLEGGKLYIATFSHTGKILDAAYGKPQSPRYVPAHAPYLYHRDAWKFIQKKFGKELNESYTHRYRQPDDISAHNIHHFTIMNELAKPSSPLQSTVKDYYNWPKWWTWMNVKFVKAGLMSFNPTLIAALNPKIICINDDFDRAEDPQAARQQVADWLLAAFPNPSPYELDGVSYKGGDAPITRYALFAEIGVVLIIIFAYVISRTLRKNKST